MGVDLSQYKNEWFHFPGIFFTDLVTKLRLWHDFELMYELLLKAATTLHSADRHFSIIFRL